MSANPEPEKRYLFPKKVGIMFIEKRKEISKVTIRNFVKVLKEKTNSASKSSVKNDDKGKSNSIDALNEGKGSDQEQIGHEENIANECKFNSCDDANGCKSDNCEGKETDSAVTSLNNEPKSDSESNDIGN